MNTTIYFAHYDSRNFSFEAFGTTEVEARNALLDGLKEHAKQYADRIEDAHWWFDDDVGVEERTIGVCYRDGSEVKK
jgi:hypothetical protein